MSSTRRAKDGGFHQERYCSATEFERGLMANLVAKRCEAITEPRDRELIWFVQLLSHRVGLDALASDLVKRFPDAAGTLPDPLYARRMKLRKQAEFAHQLEAARTCAPVGRSGEEPEPTVDLERIKGEHLPEALAEMCTNPSYSLAAFRPWFFTGLVESLREYMSDWVKTQRLEMAETDLSAEVFATLDYALQAGGVVVLDGPALRVGKSFAGRSWCDLHPGKARFVQIPATNDDIGFFRAIAQAIGSASALSFKGVQLRERVELSLQSSRLMLVLDNAHYLWPQNNRREALPNRLNWLLTALVNHGVPVALITTPQFARDQKIVEQKTGWTSAQFLSQIGDYKKLPEVLTGRDLVAVAEHCLPAGEKSAVKALALYAEGSGRYLAAIETAVKRARFIANSNGREDVTLSDVGKAISDYVIPSDRALKTALGAAGRATATASASGLRATLPITPEPNGVRRAGSTGATPPLLTPNRSQPVLESAESSI